MKRHVASLAFLFALSSNVAVQGAPTGIDSLKLQVTHDAYLRALDQLATLRDQQQLVNVAPVPDAYSFQLLSTPTLYNGPLRQMMAQGENQGDDAQLGRLNYINRTLAQLYVTNPTLVARTEEQMRQSGTLRNENVEVSTKVGSLSDKVAISAVKPKIDDETVEVITRRPNFWKYSGQGTAHFQQNYFSSNWFQNGEDNYAGNFTLTLTANYNDQKKWSWNNTLAVQLGFQTSPSDKSRTFRPTSNNLRYTTSVSRVAYKHLSYSAQINMSTPIVNVYQPNSDVLTTAILAPLDVTIAPGLRYDISWGKTRKFTGNITVAPLAYNIRYVRLDELIGRHGACRSDNHSQHNPDGSECRHSSHQFGPNITVNMAYEIIKNVKWTSRIFWFSNFSMTKIEWENTFNFQINKYISSQLYLYPRYEDSSPKYRTEGGSYIMFREWLSLGMTYNF